MPPLVPPPRRPAARRTAPGAALLSRQVPRIAPLRLIRRGAASLAQGGGLGAARSGAAHGGLRGAPSSGPSKSYQAAAGGSANPPSPQRSAIVAPRAKTACVFFNHTGWPRATFLRREVRRERRDADGARRLTRDRSRRPGPEGQRDPHHGRGGRNHETAAAAVSGMGPRPALPVSWVRKRPPELQAPQHEVTHGGHLWPV